MNKIESWKPNFFILWSGQAFSRLTSSVLQFGLVWYLTYTTQSPWVLSLAMLVGFLPRAVLGPFIGVFIDRYDRKKIMIVADVFIAVVSGVLLIVGQFTPVLPKELIYAVLFLRALGSALHDPCIRAVTPQIVPKEELARCAGYSQSLDSISQILSPALAAVLYDRTTLMFMVVLEILGAVVGVITVLNTHIPPLEERPLTRMGDIVIEAKEGWSILRGKPGLLGLAFVSALYSVALMPVSAYFPLLSISYFQGGSSSFAGTVETVFAVGLLLSALIISFTGGTKNKVNSILISIVLMTVSLIGIGLLPPSGGGMFGVLAFVMGFCGPLFWSMFHTLYQENFQQEYLGRVIALTSSITVMASPVGMIISGSFARRYGAQNWFLVAGGLTFIAGLLVLLVPVIRHCDEGGKERIKSELSTE